MDYFLAKEQSAKLLGVMAAIYQEATRRMSNDEIIKEVPIIDDYAEISASRYGVVFHVPINNAPSEYYIFYIIGSTLFRKKRYIYFKIKAHGKVILPRHSEKRVQ